MTQTIDQRETRPRRLRRLGVVALVVMLLAIGFAVAWNNGLRDQVVPRNFGIVEAGRLYRSGQISARLIEPTLREHHIQVIVALAAAGMKLQDLAAEEHAAAALGIDRELFPLSGDGTGSAAVYAAAVAAIDKALFPAPRDPAERYELQMLKGECRLQLRDGLG
ncbi:MAG TPA: hypothetical protein VLI90_12250, partial [Tepidisphaeraceae bacterium]|nr:hypothetical protein [Tepidisphaeraceae bacterium]